MRGLLVVLFVLVLGSAIVPVVSAGKEVMFVPYGSVTLRDPPSGEPMKPFGIAPDGQGYVYVTDTTSGTVSKWKIENEQCVQSWGSRGSGEGQFISPGEIVRNEWTGEIYVVDQGNLRHQILDPFANKWDMFGYRPEDLYTISGLAVTIDYAGNPRPAPGVAGGAALYDVGAFEYQLPVEVCDGIDNDGDAQVDEDCRSSSSYFSGNQSVRCTGAGWSRTFAMDLTNFRNIAVQDGYQSYTVNYALFYNIWTGIYVFDYDAGAFTALTWLTNLDL